MRACGRGVRVCRGLRPSGPRGRGSAGVSAGRCERRTIAGDPPSGGPGVAWTLYRQHRGVVAAAHPGMRSVDAGTVLRADEAATRGTTIVMPGPPRGAFGLSRLAAPSLARRRPIDKAHLIHRRRRSVEGYTCAANEGGRGGREHAPRAPRGRGGGREKRQGAGDGNRTRVASLEDWGSTIELRPHGRPGAGAAGVERGAHPSKGSRCAGPPSVHVVAFPRCRRTTLTEAPPGGRATGCGAAW